MSLYSLATNAFARAGDLTRAYAVASRGYEQLKQLHSTALLDQPIPKAHLEIMAKAGAQLKVVQQVCCIVCELKVECATIVPTSSVRVQKQFFPFLFVCS